MDVLDSDAGMQVLCDAADIGSSIDLTQQQTFPAALTTSTLLRRLPKRPSHQCRLCHRAYERADHLTRHLRSHENSRPFKCSQCVKSFNRADLLSRHRAQHDRDSSGAQRRARTATTDRASAACTECVAAKVKCQNEKPCARCVKKGAHCEVARRDSPGMVFSDHDRQHGNDKQDASMRSSMSPEPDVRYGQATEANLYADNITVDSVEGVCFGDFFDSFPVASGIPFGQDLPIPGDFAQALDFNLWDIDLDSIERAHQNFDNSVPQANLDVQLQKEGPRPPNEASKRHAAFERSPWLFRPTLGDHVLNDEASLALDEENITSALPPSPSEDSLSEFASCAINSKTRDQMLSLLFSFRRGTPQTSTLSLPSVDLLNNFVQVFFAQESYRTDALIHLGTFDSTKALPHLLLSLVSRGSTYISIPAVWKMGLALQDVVRCTVVDLWEYNNSSVRNLQALQAFLICLEIGLWSGFKRQMEIAESFAQPIVVMIRRSGALAAQPNSIALWPLQTDNDALLESKWKKWVEGESYKRLVIHLFSHDIHASIGMHKPPLMSITEFKFPLPASRNLWLAKTATVWRDLYLSRPPRPAEIPTFIEIIRNPGLLETVSEHVDVHLCTDTLLHGLWGQIWAYHESKRFYSPSNSARHLCLMTEHRELYRDLCDLSLKIPSLTKSSQITILLSDLLKMLLHVDPDELQRFAGKYGEDEAKTAAAQFKSWSQHEDSRTAIWHAGQVFRAAKSVTTARLRGFNAIAVYYASLTLWIYGLMTTPNSFGTQLPDLRLHIASQAANSSKHVILNETASIQSHNFLANNEGSPGISVVVAAENQFVLLVDTCRILEAARELYKSNFPVMEDQDGALPPLVENLGLLLRDMSS